MMRLSIEIIQDPALGSPSICKIVVGWCSKRDALAAVEPKWKTTSPLLSFRLLQGFEGIHLLLHSIYLVIEGKYMRKVIQPVPTAPMVLLFGASNSGHAIRTVSGHQVAEISPTLSPCPDMSWRPCTD